MSQRRSVPVRLTRTGQVPDPFRLERYARAPEYGPRLLFFSGGTALRRTSRFLTRYTHNSVHLITPFDSGGSSATLRQAFDMISVGDLRNRLMALADTRVKGHPGVYRLFTYRFPKGGGQQEKLVQALNALVEGHHPMVKAIPRPLRELVCNHLGFFRQEMPAGFDLAGASIGNLILCGGYLNNQRAIDPALFLFSRLVEVQGLVRPVVDAHLQLAAELASGEVVVGQHLLTGKEVPPLTSPVVRMWLTPTLESASPTRCSIDRKTNEWIEGAELICFPVGSFYTSLMACLLPEGVGRAVARAAGPRVFVVNSGADPEMLKLPPHAALGRLVATLRKDLPPAEAEAGPLIDAVLCDSEGGVYPAGLDVAAVEAHGVQVVDVPLVSRKSAPLYDPELLAQALLSLV